MGFVLFGFIVGMHGLVRRCRPCGERLRDERADILTLFAVALGDFSMDFGEAHYRSFFSTNARLMMGVFIATITLLCLNLLIAFLTDGTMSEDKDKAFVSTRAAAVVETGECVQGILRHRSIPCRCTHRWACHRPVGSERQRIGLPPSRR